MQKVVLKLWKTRYEIHLKDLNYMLSFTVSFILLIASLFINFFAGQYATRYVSNSVTDIILSNTRAYDLDGLFVYGALVLIILIATVCIIYPKKIPFTLKTIALFTIIRSIFIMLTHIGPFPTHASIDPASLINYFSFGGDLFFSGHTGLPFLLALIYWDNKYLRVLFTLTSIFFAIVVLLAHLHYSIDVFAAFFITYTIYHIAMRIFKNDTKFFLIDLEVKG